jgi:hypothetical protein
LAGRSFPLFSLRRNPARMAQRAFPAKNGVKLRSPSMFL